MRVPRAGMWHTCRRQAWDKRAGGPERARMLEPCGRASTKQQQRATFAGKRRATAATARLATRGARPHIGPASRPPTPSPGRLNTSTNNPAIPEGPPAPAKTCQPHQPP
jgi:hypothetical protein